MCNKMNYLWRPCNNEGLRLECYWKNAFYMNCLVNTLSKTLIDDKDIKPDAKVWAKIQFSVSNTFCTASLSVQYQTLCVQYQTLSVQYHFLYSIKHFMYSIKHSVYSIKHCVQYQTFSVYSIKHFLYSIKHYQTLQYQCLIKCLILYSVW